MGKGIKLPQDNVANFIGAAAKPDPQIEHLTKLVHILWKQVERLEQFIEVIPEGLRIKAGMSEILVLKNGGILLESQRIFLKTPGKNELMN
jgi:hypothetical protein